MFISLHLTSRPSTPGTPVMQGRRQALGEFFGCRTAASDRDPQCQIERNLLLRHISRVYGALRERCCAMTQRVRMISSKIPSNAPWRIGNADVQKATRVAGCTRSCITVFVPNARAYRGAVSITNCSKSKSLSCRELKEDRKLR